VYGRLLSASSSGVSIIDGQRICGDDSLARFIEEPWVTRLDPNASLVAALEVNANMPDFYRALKQSYNQSPRGPRVLNQHTFAEFWNNIQSKRKGRYRNMFTMTPPRETDSFQGVLSAVFPVFLGHEVNLDLKSLWQLENNYFVVAVDFRYTLDRIPQPIITAPDQFVYFCIDAGSSSMDRDLWWVEYNEVKKHSNAKIKADQDGSTVTATEAMLAVCEAKKPVIA